MVIDDPLCCYVEPQACLSSDALSSAKSDSENGNRIGECLSTNSISTTVDCSHGQLNRCWLSEMIEPYPFALGQSGYAFC